MRNRIRKLTAWALTVLMLVTYIPTELFSSADEPVVDYSDAIQLPWQTGNPEATETGTDGQAEETVAPEGETDGQAGETETPEGETDGQAGETETPEGETETNPGAEESTETSEPTATPEPTAAPPKVGNITGDTEMGMTAYSAVGGTYIPKGARPIATLTDPVTLGSDHPVMEAVKALSTEKNKPARVMTYFTLGSTAENWQPDGKLHITIMPFDPIPQNDGDVLRMVRIAENGETETVELRLNARRGMIWGYIFDIFSFGDYAILQAYEGQAEPEPETVTVTFLGMDGSVVETREVVSETAIGPLPEAPVVEGYTFQYWITDDGIITEDTVTNADMVARASYREDYPATVADAATDKVAVHVEVPAGSLPEDAMFRMRTVDAESYRDAVELAVGSEVGEIVAVDMTFVSAYNRSVEYQPLKPVTVQVTLNALRSAERLSVVHISDNGEGEVVASGITGTDFSFEAESFSVYAITDESGNAVVARARYHFIGDDGNEITQQIIKNLESLNEVEGPRVAGKAFTGWYLWSGNTFGDQVALGEPITVLFGNDQAIYYNSVVVPNNQVDPVDVYLKAKYTTDFGTVYFLNDNATSINVNDPDVVLDSIAVPMPSGENSTVYTLPEAADFGPTVADVSYEFVGWSTEAPRRINGVYQYYSDSDNRDTISTLNVQKGRTYQLYPVFKKAHWIYFNSAPTGSGATYISPAWVKDGQTARSRKPDDPEWEGYRFLYWTETPTFDSNGKLITFEEPPEEYDFDQTLTEDVRLYGYWATGYTNYTVVIWKQKVTDDKNAEDESKTYEFEEQHTVTDVELGSIVNASDADKTKDYLGFHYAKSDENVVVASGGTSVVNVYYDRDLITMKFYNGNGAPSGGYNSTYYTTEPSGYVTTTDDDGVQYALVDGEYVELTKEETTTTTVYYYYNDFWGDQIEYTGTFYTKSGNRYTATQYNGNNLPSSGTYYTESIWGTRYQLHRGVKETTTVTWYLNGSPYTGTRYKMGGTAFWYTGLYGQTLEQNGYSWPSGLWKYYNDDNGTTGMSFLGEFVLPDGVRDETGKEIRLYSDNSGGTTINFYLQNTDGTWPTVATDTGYGSQNATFYFSEKYDGFMVYQFRKDSANTWSNAVVGQYTSGYTTLHIRYARKKYDILYYDPINNQPLTVRLTNGDVVQSATGILYGAPTANYYPDSSFSVDSTHRGYSANGRWYADRAQTIQVFFTEPAQADLVKLWYYVDTSGEKIYTNYVPTAEQLAMTLENDGRQYGQDAYSVIADMPMHDQPIYAGFSKDWYWIKIEPEGGVLPLDGTSSTYFWLEYGDTINEYTISRNYVEDSSGEYYYHYAEFNTSDPDGYQPSPRRAWYDTEAVSNGIGNDGKKYRPAKPGEGYDFIGWYLVNGDTLTPYNFDTEVTTNVTLRAVWRQRGDYHVYYDLSQARDANGNPLSEVTATGVAPVDHFQYAEYANVVVTEGTVGSSDEEYVFAGWYFNNRVLTAGQVFTANPNLAEKDPRDTSTDALEDTFILYPVFVKKDSGSPVSETVTTRLILDANGGTLTEAYQDGDDVFRYVIEASQEVETAEQLVNFAIQLPEDEVCERDKCEFLGWAYSKDAKEPVFVAGQIVGIDNVSGSGYLGNNENILYAVWRRSEVTVKIRKIGEESQTTLSGAQFTLQTDDGTVSLQSGSDGYGVSSSGESVFTLKTPVNKTDADRTYALTENQAPTNYEALFDTGFISVSYDATVTYTLDGTEYTASQDNNENYIIVVHNNRKKTPVQIRKVDDNGNPLSGATFTLTGKIAAGEVSEIGSSTVFDGTLCWGETYTLTETETPDGYDGLSSSWQFTIDSSTGNVTTTSSNELITVDTTVNPQTISVKNKRMVGTLNISKVTSPANIADSKSYKVTVKNGADKYLQNLNTPSFGDDPVLFDVSVNNQLTISNLPTDVYIVEEVEGTDQEYVGISGYSLLSSAVTYKDASGQSIVAATVTKNANTYAVVTNTYKKSTVPVNISKTFTGIDKSKLPSSSFTISYTSTDGSAGTLKLTDSGVSKSEDELTYSWIISDVEIGAVVTATEAGYEVTGYKAVPDAVIKTLTVQDSTDTGVNKISFTNTYFQGSLKIQKVVTGTENSTDLFAFTATVNGTLMDGYTLPTGVTYNSNSKTFSFNLTAGGSVTLPNLPPDATYTVTETSMPNGYTLSSSENAAGTITTGETVSTFTNNYETVDIRLTKTWDDLNNRYGLRPTASDYSRYLTLAVTPAAAGTVSVTPTVTDNGNNTYTVIWAGLPKYMQGNEVSYSVSESSINEYTAGTMTGSAAEGYAITNTLKTATLIVKKTVLGVDEADSSLIPETFSFEIINKQGNQVMTTGTVAANGQTEVPVPLGRRYAVQETGTADYAITGYDGPTVSYDKYAQDTGSMTDGSRITASIKNAYTRQTKTITTTKVWADETNQDGRRDNVTLVLSGTVDGETGTVYTASHELSGTQLTTNSVTFTDTVPVYYQGKPITYSATELGAVNGKITLKGAEYTVTVSGDADSGFIVTNSHTPEKLDIMAQKVWMNGTKDISGTIRNAEVTFTLESSNGGTYAPANTVPGYKKTLKTEGTASAEAWKAEWTDLPRYRNGKEVTYRVVESGAKVNGAAITLPEATTVTVNATDYITVSGRSNPTATVTFTNTLPTTEQHAVKNWDDAIDPSRRPESIIFTLAGTVDGTDVLTGMTGYSIAAAKTVTADAWQADWTALPVYDDTGAMIVYDVTENGITDYTQTDKTYNSNTLTWTITNKLDQGTLAVTKTAVIEPASAASGMIYTFTVRYGTKWLAMDNQGKVSLSDTEVVHSVAAGGSVQFKNIPVGSYIVTETGTGEDGAAQIQNYTLVTAGSGSYTVAKGGESSANLVNTYTRNAGTLTVSKTVVDDSSETGTNDAAFAFSLTLSEAPLTGFVLPVGVSEQENTEGKTYTFGLTNGGSVTFENLPAGATYSVTETTSTDYMTTIKVDETDSENAAGTIPNGGTATAAFTNIRKVGTIQITKEVVDQAGTVITAETMPTYSFTVERVMTDPETDEETTEMFRSVEITGAGTVKMENVPLGTYIIKEAVPASNGIAGYQFVETVYPDNAAQGRVTIVEDQENQTVTVTNEYVKLVPVTVTKTFSGITETHLAEVANSFQISYTSGAVAGDDADIGGTDDAGDENGETTAYSGTLTMKDEGVEKSEDGMTYTWTVSDIPVGAVLTFTESGYEHDWYEVTTVPAADETSGKVSVAVTVDADETKNTAEFTNNYMIRTVDVTLEKLVTGNMANPKQEFSFTVTAEDGRTHEPVTFTVAARDGQTAGTPGTTGTFVLMSGEAQKLEGLPYGATVTVTETNADGYTTTATSNSEDMAPSAVDGTERTFTFTIPVVTGETVVPEAGYKVTVTNHQEMYIPPTGIDLEIRAWMLMMGIALMGLAGMLLRRKAGRRNEFLD